MHIQHVAPALRWWKPAVERGLLFLGLLALGWSALILGEQRYREVAFQRSLDTAAATHTAIDAEPSAIVPSPGETLGHLIVGGHSAIVQEGVDASALRVGAGRVPGTAWPPDKGNVAIAGHRDSVFRVLSGVGVNDHVSLVLPAGARDYVVDEILVVDPTDTWVLAASREPRLTLITCYPFSWVGPAPQRLIVRARLVGNSS